MLRRHNIFGVAIAGAGLIAVPAMPPPMPDVQTHTVALTSGDDADLPLGDGTALIMGTSGNPAPPQAYLEAIDQLISCPISTPRWASFSATSYTRLLRLGRSPMLSSCRRRATR